MTKYLIVDDESIAHDIIKGYCDLLPEMQLMKNCYDAIEALAYLNTNEIDLIFLDLNMPKLKGFDFLKTLNNPPQIIVTTAYKEFAIEGYELNVVDYLLKPFSFERFLKAIHKANLSTAKPNVIQPEKESRVNTIFLRTNKKHIQVIIDDILFLESSGNYVKVITTNETIIIRNKISKLLEKFSKDNFIKVHKSFAVAKNRIKSIEGNRIFIQNYEIPIGKMFKKKVYSLMGL